MRQVEVIIENAGRKKIDNEPKRTITFSVPEGVAERIKEVVRDEVAKYRASKIQK